MGDSDELAQIRQRRMAEMQAMQVLHNKVFFGCTCLLNTERFVMMFQHSWMLKYWRANKSGENSLFQEGLGGTGLAKVSSVFDPRACSPPQQWSLSLLYHLLLCLGAYQSLESFAWVNLPHLKGKCSCVYSAVLPLNHVLLPGRRGWQAKATAGENGADGEYEERNPEPGNCNDWTDSYDSVYQILFRYWTRKQGLDWTQSSWPNLRRGNRHAQTNWDPL